MVTIITYFSVIIGELVPKQLALKNPEMIACRVAYAMNLLSKVSGPFVWVLDGSARILIGLLGLKESSEATVTDEEIKTLIAEAEIGGRDRERRAGHDRRRHAAGGPAGACPDDADDRRRRHGPRRRAEPDMRRK